MPIRFRCAYCNQLMGIARRKAGTVVHCPKCKGQVVVPTPEGEPEPDEAPSPQPAPDHLPNPVGGGEFGGNVGEAAGGPIRGPGAGHAGAVFERSDFEEVFEPRRQNPQILHQPTVAPMAPPPLTTPGSASGIRLAPAPASPASASGRGFVLSPAMMALVCALVVILMGLSFFLGMLLGRSGSNSTAKENTSQPLPTLVSSIR